LADSATEQPNEITLGEPKKTRPPPIFVREKITIHCFGWWHQIPNYHV